MPFKPQIPILQVESTAIHTVDTRSAEQLFGLWSVFSKCAETMEEGRRLENLSWRLWNRETFCCAPEHISPNASLFTTPRWSYTRKTSDSGSLSIPALSSSVESDDSDDRVDSASTLQSAASSRPHIRRHDSTESRNRGTEKHLTPVDLESLVMCIKEKKDLEPLAPLPMPAPEQKGQESATEQRVEESNPPPANPKPQMVSESSTSTVATTLDSDLSKMSPPVIGSDSSTSTDSSAHSVVRGFSPGRVSSSYRSRTNLQQQAMPTPIIRQPQHTAPAPMQMQKKKGAMFTLGGSSDEDGNSSLETHMQMSQMSNARSSLSDGLRKPQGVSRKQTSFKDEISARMPERKAYESEEVFETDSEDEVSDNAIEEDDESQWEDSDDESGPSSVNNDKQVSFQRVDSKPNLTSRRSLLTTLMHEGDRAQALQNAASRSTPALRRSRTTSPNGPSMTASPNNQTLRYQPAQPSQPAPPAQPVQREPEVQQIPRSKPIIMTTSNTCAPPALSPRTTRRNMLTTELTESLRKHLLWERQQKNSTNNAVLKRRHTSTDVKNLKNYPGEAQPSALPTVKEHNAKGNNSWTTNYFDSGLQEYHERGW